MKTSLIVNKIGNGFYQVKPHQFSVYYANIHKRSTSRRYGWEWDIRDNRFSKYVEFTSANGSLKESLEDLEDLFAKRYTLIDEEAQKRHEEIETLLAEMN